MKNFLLDENEKNEILKKHEDLKKSLTESVSNRIKNVNNFRVILSEQSDPIFIDNRSAQQVMKDCVTDPTVKANFYVFKGKPAIKVNGGPDNIRIYTNEPNQNFGGYNWYILNTAETKILKGPYKWSCPAKQGPNPDAEDIKRELATGLWKKRDEINVPDTELKQLYDQHPKYKDLFKKKDATGKTGAYTDEQQAWIDVWGNQKDTKTGMLNALVYKTQLTPTENASGEWVDAGIAPGSEKIFPNGGLHIWEKQTLSKVNTDVLKDILDNQTINVETCRQNVLSYFNLYNRRNSVPVTPKQLDGAKRVVQACADTYYNKWGIIGSLKKGEGNRSLNHYIDVLRGGAGGPSPYGDDAKWKLK
jgi:hypothetical protein